MRNSVRTFVGTGVLGAVLSVALVATAGPAQAAAPVVLDQGHVDVIGVAFEDGRLHLHVHDEEGEAEYEPEDVLLRALPEAETTVPADPAYSFLGEAGDPVWILPQVQNPDLLWPGVGAEELDPGVLRGDKVSVTVAGTGPGAVAIYTENAFGLPADILVDTDDGQPDTFPVVAGDHAHMNWAFEKPGHYWLAVLITGRLASTGKIVADAGLYHFHVVG